MSAKKLTRALGLRLLRGLRNIRQFEERIIGIYPTDVMVTPVHLHIGQEAVPVGVCDHLKDADTICFGHRTHGPALAKGLSMRKLMAELYGRTTGCSHGFGGSMHLVDPERGMLGSSAIVGGSIAVGVGAALANKLGKRDNISVSYFGDGATNSGVFWESMNFAALKQVPVLFVCENNDLSNVMRKSEHMFADIPKAAELFMKVWLADGTDVLEVHAAAGAAVKFVRENCKPALLHCPTKRWMKHQGVDQDDLDFNPVDRVKDCPIHRLEQHLLREKLATRAELDAIQREVEKQIDDAIEFALKSPFPTPETLVTEI
jgi:acetoin:2,6-dichlorophenolindophenol oxidoreductase subunit alpha